MTRQDEREDGIMVAEGSFAAMAAEGETLADRWSETIEIAAEVTRRPLDQVTRVLVGLGYGPFSAELADNETRAAIGDGLCGLLYSLRTLPAAPKPDHVEPAVLVMASPDWPPFWCAVQAMCLLHGISEAAATTALFCVPSSDDERMSDLAFRMSVVATASLFVQHSETLH